ncbi:MAG: DUF1223 domain-containing protein [Pseudomonadota bacterium]
MNKIWTGLALCAALQSAWACSGQSPAHSLALMELYTSEGCDSCPPADDYVRGLRASGLGADQAVLLSLHVDYWNYIGWKDPFSRAAFTERQRWLTGLAGSRTVYTPELFVAGQELRGGVAGWSRGIPALVKKINERPAQANIGISLGALAADGLPLIVKATAQAPGTLYVALVENKIAVNVTAGENRGHTLRHEFVVREWLPPQELGRDKAATLTRTVALPAGAVGKNLGVAAFVQSERGEVLQAFSLPVCGS